MSVTNELTRGRRHAAGIGLLGALLVPLFSPSPIDATEAVASAEVFLDHSADDATLSADGQAWTVSARGEQVVVDAQTGEAVEFVFVPADG
ncbi:MAG: hypothetical protein ACE37F_06070 [Nannocystaceae bacterium]|nr:hypothetical protein [bacterium]